MTANPPTDIPTPGWFTDPNVAGQERWWDGAAWGEQIRPKASTPFDLSAWLKKHRVTIALLGLVVLVVLVIGISLARIPALGSYNKADFEQGLLTSLNEGIDSTRIQKVECPATASTSTGSTFECFASAINGKNLVVKITFQDDEGGYFWQVQ